MYSKNDKVFNRCQCRLLTREFLWIWTKQEWNIDHLNSAGYDKVHSRFVKIQIINRQVPCLSDIGTCWKLCYKQWYSNYLVHWMLCYVSQEASMGIGILILTFVEFCLVVNANGIKYHEAISAIVTLWWSSWMDIFFFNMQFWVAAQTLNNICQKIELQ